MDYDDYYDDYDDDYEETLAYVKKVKEQLKGVKVTDAQIVRKLEETNYDIKKTVNFFKPKESKPIAPAKGSVSNTKQAVGKPVASVKNTPNVASTGSVQSKAQVVSETVFNTVSAPPTASKHDLVLSDDEDLTRSSEVPSKTEKGNCPSTTTTGSENNALTMVVTGHVDAGKSTLVGHLLYKCGQVAQRTIHKYEKDSKNIGKASFSLAWVTDESKAEREHGVTIDVAERSMRTEHRFVTILDTPGHRDFIPNMIKGAAQADVALLVVPASEGEFESSMKDGAQTREHATLLKALGVSQIIVVVNKMDCTSPHPWSESRFQSIEHTMRSLLCTEMGFNDRLVRVVPLSGLAGQNITTVEDTCALKSWYSGPTLLQLIDTFLLPMRGWQKPLRAVVHEVVCSDAARGRVELEVSVLQGRLRCDHTIGFFDTAVAKAPVKAIQSDTAAAPSVNAKVGGNDTTGEHSTTTATTATPTLPSTTAALKYTVMTATAVASSSTETQAAEGKTDHTPTTAAGILSAGERGRIILQNKHHKGQDIGIREGSVLFKGPAVPQMCVSFKASLSTMAQLHPPVIPGTCFELYLYGTEVQCRVTKLHSMIVQQPHNAGSTTSNSMVVGAESEVVKKPKCIPGCAQAIVSLTLDQPILIESVKECRALGRFALRSRGKTVAVGVCEKIL